MTFDEVKIKTDSLVLSPSFPLTLPLSLSAFRCIVYLYVQMLVWQLDFVWLCLTRCDIEANCCFCGRTYRTISSRFQSSALSLFARFLSVRGLSWLARLWQHQEKMTQSRDFEANRICVLYACHVPLYTSGRERRNLIRHIDIYLFINVYLLHPKYPENSMNPFFHLYYCFK